MLMLGVLGKEKVNHIDLYSYSFHHLIGFTLTTNFPSLRHRVEVISTTQRVLFKTYRFSSARPFCFVVSSLSMLNTHQLRECLCKSGPVDFA